MTDLEVDDPAERLLTRFSTGHALLAVIKRCRGRFPHRNMLLQRVSTVAEEEFLGNDSFRFDLPLIRRPNGSFVFAGTTGQKAHR